MKKNRKTGKNVILLEDLIPRKTVTGGSGKILFGERANSSGKPTPEQKKDRKKKE